ncbi:hypothetical protein [Mesorhizobium sp. SP-1A]|jgi:hypothetical protein|uniref:hypothetical protein n=1 Tax=Mesorhizobium sp. SP-1A TaxID=3077840 RepID=UPI0028F6CDE9|nr:hypothetical protein [Mesorhizobium sp. SP-1A]
MFILSSIGRIAAEFAATRARYRTRRMLSALPLEMQKDIGWPEASCEPARNGRAAPVACG